MESASVLGFLAFAKKPPRAALIPILSTIVAGVAPAFLCVPSDWILKWGGPYSGLFVGLSDVPGNLNASLIYAVVPRILKYGGWPAVMRLYALQVALAMGFMAGFQALELAQPTKSSPLQPTKSSVPKAVHCSPPKEWDVEEE